LGTIVFDRADAVDDDVTNEPAISSLDHPILDIDLAAVARLDDGHHFCFVADARLTAPAHHHAVDRADRAGEPCNQTALEQL